MANEKNIQEAFDAVRFMEELLTHDFTAEHEIYFDPDISEQGMPFVSVTVSDEQGLETLTGLFGENIEFARPGEERVVIPVIIKPMQPGKGMN